MATSIVEVSRALGISTASVSRALSGKPGVSDALRAKVIAKAAELHYSPSPHAASLASGKTQTIGIVTPYIARWYFASLVAAVEGALSAAGHDVLLYHISSEATRDRFFARMPPRKRVDALVVLLLPTPDEVIALRALDMPIAVSGPQEEGFSSVDTAESAGAEVAVQHLINLGHRRIAMVGGARDVVPMHFQTPNQRRQGFEHALERAGLPIDLDLQVDGQFTAAGGERAMSRILANRERPTAVFAQSDEMAIGAMRTIRRHGLRVPEDISMIGYDDHDMAEMVGLTTMAQPLREIGEALAAATLAQVNDGEAPTTNITLTAHLLMRETTSPFRTS